MRTVDLSHILALFAGEMLKLTMGDFTQVEYRCGHLRSTVRAWCKCPPHTDYANQFDANFDANQR